MPDRPAIRPGSLRRRLTIAFLLVAGLSAAALVVASYAIVREARLSDAVDRSVEQSRFNLVLANETLTPNLSAQEIEQLLAAYGRRGGFETVGAVGPRRFSSSVSLSIQEVPAALRELVSAGKLGYERVTVAGTLTSSSAARVKEADTELYYFYSEERLWDELARSSATSSSSRWEWSRSWALSSAPSWRGGSSHRSGARARLPTPWPKGCSRRACRSNPETSSASGPASFNEMAEALEGKIRALSESQARERRFTSDVSHELRTPLTALVAEASLLERAPRPHAARSPPPRRAPGERRGAAPRPRRGPDGDLAPRRRRGQGAGRAGRPGLARPRSRALARLG